MLIVLFKGSSEDRQLPTCAHPGSPASSEHQPVMHSGAAGPSVSMLVSRLPWTSLRGMSIAQGLGITSPSRANGAVEPFIGFSSISDAVVFNHARPPYLPSPLPSTRVLECRLKRRNQRSIVIRRNDLG